MSGSLIAELTPPAVRRLARFVRRKVGLQYETFRGVYQDFRDVPAHGTGFNGSFWVQSEEQALGKALESSRRDGFVTKQTKNVDLLSVLGGIEGARRRKGSAKKQPLRILDFGGGLASSYVATRGNLPLDVPLEYHVIETPAVCIAGQAAFSGNPRVLFHTVEAPPTPATRFDIVYIRTALQYVEDWKALIRLLTNYQPRWFLFISLLLVDTTTFATAQINVRGSSIPCWFVNEMEFDQLVTSLGFTRVFQSFYETAEWHDNLPEPRRIKRARDVLYGRF